MIGGALPESPRPIADERRAALGIGKVGAPDQRAIAEYPQPIVG